MSDNEHDLNQLGDDDGEEYDLTQEQIIQTILMLGNDIWKNFG